jgi:hypothetical protein
MCISFKWFQNDDIIEQKNESHMLKNNIDNLILIKCQPILAWQITITLSLNKKI